MRQLVFWILVGVGSWAASGCDLPPPPFRSRPAPDPMQVDRMAAKVQIAVLSEGVESYQRDTKQYPSQLFGLQALMVQPADLPNGVRWIGPYLEKGVPLDPWDRPYQYSTPGRRNPNTFDIWSLGADGVDGTDDDIGNW